MQLGFAIWLLAAPLLNGPLAPSLDSGQWPAGVLLAATERLTQSPIYPESPTVGNARVVLSRPLTLTRESIPAIASLLLDSGVALIELTPGSPSDGWIATRRIGGVHRPIAISIRVLRLEHADVEQVALLLNTKVEIRERDLPPGDIPTRFIADPRTGAIVVRYTSEKRLSEYLEILEVLDRPSAPGASTPVLRSYRPQRVTARVLEVEFAAAWRKRGGYPIRLVVPEKQNMLLVRCPLQVWGDVEGLLELLDLTVPIR